MSAVNGSGTSNRVVAILESLRAKGIRLWTSEGQLHYEAPKGALGSNDIQELRSAKDQLITLLERIGTAEANEPQLIERKCADRAPFSFSQQAHWNLYHLSDKPSFCQVLSVTSVGGRLDIGVLQDSLTEMVRRHEILRTRIVIFEGVPIQKMEQSADCLLQFEDLECLPVENRESEVSHVVERILLQPVNVHSLPVIRAQLLKIRDDAHVLIVSIEHLFADQYSMSLLLRDLFSTYFSKLIGATPSLPSITMQFADFANWQRQSSSSWYTRHRAYWEPRLRVYGRQPFPVEGALTLPGDSQWELIHFDIDKKMTADLRAWCKSRYTTLVLSVFTAYAALVLRWCKTTKAIFPYEIDGRVSPKIENTIGYFASVLYLEIDLPDGASMDALLKQIKERYCDAYEHADSSYIEALIPRPEFTRNGLFNWASHGPSISHSLPSDCVELLSFEPFPVDPRIKSNLHRDTEPIMFFIEGTEAILGGFQFQAARLSSSAAQRFIQCFQIFLRTLLTQPERRIDEIPC